MASVERMTREEEAQIQQALAELRSGRRGSAGPTAAAPVASATDGSPLTQPAAQRPATSVPTPRVPPVDPLPSPAAAQPPLTASAVTSAATMRPETQARIALLLEREAEEREARRQRQRRMVFVAGGIGALIVAAIFVATSLGTQAAVKKKTGTPPAAGARSG
jgi:hypothetical protein